MQAAVASELSLAEFLAYDSQFATALSSRISASWQHAGIRSTLDRLSQTTGKPIWLDRRVDPELSVNLEANDRTIRDIVQQVASQHNLVAQPIANLIYVGTQEHAEQLREAIARGRRLAAAANRSRGELSTTTQREWQRLTTPVAVVRQMAGDALLEITSFDRIPHDLLPETTLPELSLADQLTLVLCGFDLGWKLNEGGAIEIVDLPTTEPIDRRYEMSAGRRRAMLQATRDLPEGTWRRDGNSIRIRAAIGQHERFAFAAGLLKAPENIADAPAAIEDRRFTLRLQNQPAGPVIEQIARQLSASVDATRVDANRYNERVTVTADKATLDELLTAIGNQAQLTIRRTGNRWTVEPQ